jgi:hypothetical protein
LEIHIYKQCILSYLEIFTASKVWRGMKINDVVRRKLDWTWKFLGYRIPAEV